MHKEKRGRKILILYIDYILILAERMKKEMEKKEIISNEKIR